MDAVQKKFGVIKINKVISYLKACFNNKEQISSAVHQSMLKYFKEYLCVGGMPSVVDIF